MCLQGAIGTVYFDDIQLEENVAPSNYNMVGGISSWNKSSYCSVTSYSDAYGSRDALFFLGAPDRDVYAEQVIPVNKSAETTFMLSAWAVGNSIPYKNEDTFSLKATIRYTDNTEEEAVFPFQSEIRSEKQFISGILVPKESSKIVKDIVLTLSYKNNCNSVYIYDIALVQEEVQTYIYNDNGNLEAVNQTDTSTISSLYDNLNNLVEQQQNNQLYTYTYKTTGNKHLLDTVTNDGITMSFTYDSSGNVTGTTVTGVGASRELSSSSSYSADHNYIIASQDANGITATYAYNPRNLLITTTDAKGVSTEYDYNEYNDRATIAYISGLISVNYNYLNGELSNIVRGGYIPGNSIKQNQTYSFAYDGFGNVTSVSVGNYTLVSYIYAAYNGHLLRTTYGNGTYIENVYDELDRIVQIKINGIVKYKYLYNGNGDLYCVEDVDNNTTYCYNYDSLGRLISSYQKTGSSVSLLTQYEYDKKSRVSAYHCGLAGVAGGTLGQTYSYTYNEDDGSLAGISVSGENINGDQFGYDYDTLKRLYSKSVTGQYRTLAQLYVYKDLTETRTTTQIEKLKWTLQNSSVLEYSYTYDAVGNITAVYKDDSLIARYTYDDQGQLLTEQLYDSDVIMLYGYDTYGNIRSVTQYQISTATLLDTETYGYTNTSWLDRLTSYNGTAITYDNIGNPLSYNNGSAYAFTWQNGRELAAVTKGGVTTSYQYGADGLRTQKTYGSTTYSYYYSDGRLIRQTWGTHYIDFLYDESGTVYSIVNDGTQYYFVKNLQGDVVQIRSIYGTVVVEYTYDAWGNVLSATGLYADTLGVNNPIRYRGYYYDFETGFYYLQSRYYDPAIRRFINADGYVNANGDLLGFNLFAYCGNNPVMGYDPTGEWSWSKFFNGAKLLSVGITAIAAAATILTCGAAAPVMVAVAAVTLTAGTLTAVNGVAEVVEAGTDYNFVRDGAFGGNAEAYNTYSKAMETVSEVGTIICGSYYAAKGGNVCFVAGTMIVASVGLVPIEEIKAGDMVYAHNPETGETELKEVVRTFKNEATELVHLTIDGEEITCTNEHPFYSPVKGWTAACQLRAGDRLVTLNGEYVIVEQVQHELLESPVTVYNFEVEGFHTYFVGETSVLVHNRCSVDDISTGRTTPNNLTEKLAMDSAKSNPSAGKVLNIKLKDTRLPEGSVKMSQIFDTSKGRIHIHYVWDKVKNMFFDFKFK